ncbi:MAG: ATP-dependent DNA helicase [Candidatus Eisenbacteria bacterium]|nr:ATP-dependent DNA helicase [Candidatus Eisenbacteria bacterium]
MTDTAGLRLEEALRLEHPRYEPRPDQGRMASDVADCLQRGGVLLAEAPTGLGKTLAYLLPAVEWARASGQPVVVSTHTKSLQDQILDSELPILGRALGGDVRVVRLKGRENYLCRSRVEGFLAERAGTPEARRLEALLASVPDGDLSAVDDGDNAWEPFRGQELDAGHCPSEICRDTRGCWLRKARRQAQEAHVVVVNHALWLTDRMAGGVVLPEFSRLVVDEAHHLPDAFTRALSVRFTQRSFGVALDRLLGKPRAAGQLKALQAALKGHAQGDVFAGSGSASLEREREAARALQEALEAVRPAGEGAFEDLSRVAGQGGRVRLDGCSDPTEVFPPRLDDLLDRLRDALRAGEAWRALAPEEPDSASKLRPYVVRSLGQWEKEAQALLALTGPIPDGRCATLEFSRPSGVTLESVPWNVGREASAELTGRLESVVLTSATLAADGKFDYLCGRLGLEAGDVRAEAYVSGIDPARQLLALSVSGVPDPREPGYLEAAADTVAELATLGRNTLVLATSWESLRGLAGLLEPRVPQLLTQDDPRRRSQLARRFRGARGAVLLGVQSFWEGVDFPGEALEVLVMLRLPFGVPTDPVFEARKRDYEARGLDPFRDLAVPEAVLRFRQGVGRLLRRSTDRGVFVLLDRRAGGSGYGRSFVAALGTPLRQARGAREAAAAAGEFLGAGTVTEG